MWCVAELDEEYLRRMEDVLALYEKPFSEKEPVVCIDEKPVVLHADLRPPGPCSRDEFFGETASTSAVVRPTRFAEWSPRRDDTLSPGDPGPLLARVCRLSAADC